VACPTVCRPPAKYTRNANVDITVGADPVIDRRVSVWLPGVVKARRTIAGSREPLSRHELASGQQRCQLSETVAVPADEHGEVTGIDAVKLDDALLVRYSASLGTS
jgi:hypothetical protein